MSVCVSQDNHQHITDVLSQLWQQDPGQGVCHCGPGRVHAVPVPGTEAVQPQGIACELSLDVEAMTSFLQCQSIKKNEEKNELFVK